MLQRFATPAKRVSGGRGEQSPGDSFLKGFRSPTERQCARSLLDALLQQSDLATLPSCSPAAQEQAQPAPWVPWPQTPASASRKLYKEIFCQGDLSQPPSSSPLARDQEEQIPLVSWLLTPLTAARKLYDDDFFCREEGFSVLPWALT